MNEMGENNRFEDSLRMLLHFCFQEEHPKFLIDIASGDGFLLHSLQRLIQSEYPHLSPASLPKLIGFNPNFQVSRGNADILTVGGACSNGALMREQLASLGASDLKDAVCIYFPTAERTEDAMGAAAEGLLFDDAFSTLLKPRGLIVLTRPDDFGPSARVNWMRNPRELLLRLSGSGIFPDPGLAFEWAQTPHSDEISVVRFRRRNYRIRLGDEADITSLLALERACWAPGSRASASMLRARLERNPAGQLVLENERGVVGAVYSQRVASDDLGGSSIFTINELHDDKGPMVLLLALNVLPEMQDRSYGDQLLEFMLQCGAATPMVRAVIGVTRCKDYAKHNTVEISQYITLRNEQGRLVDTVLRFHELHGAKIERLVPNYRPRDIENSGFGVLVRYEGRRQRKELSVEASKLGDESISASDIESFVASSVATILHLGDVSGIEVARPLFELGMDSADLLDLRERIRAKFNLQLDATFFAEHGTCQRVAKHLSERLQKEPRSRAETPDQPVAGGHPSALPIATAAHRNRTYAPKGDAIAIVGMACRLPGGIGDRHTFWDALIGGKSMIGRLPAGRWEWPAGIDPHGKHRGIDRGGFIHGVDEFDPLFFRLSPKDATLLDPQQRLLLQLAWSCVEDAGYSARDLAGTDTGVYIGASGSDYQLRLYSEQIDHIDGHFGLSTSMALLANRISYFFDWNGPSIQVDTACSSSLVAVHQAVFAIKSGMCDQALVGGVNLMCHPANSVAFYSAGMLSKDGRCKTFSRSADGYVRGEGGALFLLKPLDAALSAGDRIHGMIAGTAINHGGQTAGLTVPSNVRQAALVKSALARAGVAAETISYVETHGTGTPLGDPTEVRGLVEAFAGGQNGGATPHCGLGSVKTNVGHLEAAAGAAGLFKVLLQLQHKTLAKSLHCEDLNPHIQLDGSPFYVVRQSQPWTPLRDAGGDELPRRAGISSFGSGGANAHIVIEEYVAEPEAGAASALQIARQPVMIVLSAKNEERLKERARQLLDAIAACPLRDEDLLDVAYTLQLGRQAMDARLGLVISSLSQLDARLRSYLAGDAKIEGLHFGEASRNKDILEILADDEIQGAITKWLEKGQHGKLLKLWVNGVSLDWAMLYRRDRPRRFALPTYPFAKERYWLPSKEAAHGPRVAVTIPEEKPATILHPLLHEDASDQSGQRFLSRFSGEEFFLSDHVVEGRRVLPGVAHLEMVREAAAQSAKAGAPVSGIRLRDVVWAYPIVADSRAVYVSIDPWSHDSGETAFEIWSHDLGRAKAERRLHSQGRIAATPAGAAPMVDIHTLRVAPGTTAVSADELYETFRAMGLAYGPAHRSVRTLLIGGDRQGRPQVLAQLALPDSIAESAGQYALHPSLLDGAMQAALRLPSGEGALSSGVPLPFAVEEVTVFGPSPSRGWAWARERLDRGSTNAQRKLDIDICDDDGNISVALRGFSLRVSQQETPVRAEQPVAMAPTGTEAVMLTPVWEATPPAFVDPWPAPTDAILILGGGSARQAELHARFPDARVIALEAEAEIDAIADRLGAAEPFHHVLWLAPEWQSPPSDESMLTGQRSGVVQCFRLIKAVLKRGYGARPLGWTIVTTQTQPIERRDELDPTHASVHGLIGSMAKEFSTWRVRLVDMPRAGRWPVADLFKLPPDERGNAWGYRHGEWYRRRLIPGQINSSGKTLYRQGGVYVVIGGAGGIGEVWSEYMIRKYQARIIWIGRRAVNAVIEAKLQRLARLGPAPAYFTADASDETALTHVYEQIMAAHGSIQGVIHSAIVLHDASLGRMEEPGFLEALRVKVDVSVRLAQVFGRGRLDFILFFSSMLSLKTPPGQSNYAAGSAFEDAIAHHLAHASPHAVKVMNWGYWGIVGIVASQEYRDRMARLGQGSLEPDESMAALEALLEGAQTQIVFLKPTKPFTAADDVSEEQISVHPTEFPSTIAGVRQHAIARALDGQPERSSGLQEINRLLHRLLWIQLRNLEFPRSPADFSTIKAALGIQDLYDRWLTETLKALTMSRYLATDGQAFWKMACPETDDLAAWKAWDASTLQWLADPALAANVQLLDNTLRALPDILTGAARATDVLFPNASMALVERFYKDNSIADYLNEVTAQVVTGFVEERLKQDNEARIRILEIGAGTGGTSARVFARLKPYRRHIEEYCYTDLSHAFLSHGERVFGAENPYLRTQLFDVEKSIAGQGFASGQYDLVIATNVLHATRNIRRTVRNAKAVLRGNGLLLLNEIVEKSLFLHLTFGLLKGWWLSEDKAVRLSGSPCLSVDSWLRVLEGEGFSGTFFPASTAGLGQQVVVAESDGIVRQERVSASVAKAAPTTTRPAPPPPQQKLAHQTIGSHVRDVIIDNISRSLKLRRELIENDRPFSDYGFDSIVSVGLVNDLNKDLHINLPTISIFDFNTVDRLCDKICAEFGPKFEQNTSLTESHAAAAPIAAGGPKGPSRMPAAPVEAQPGPVNQTVGDHLRDIVLDNIARLLGMNRDRIESDRPFSDYGIDSIVSVGLVNDLNNVLHIHLATIAIFDFNTVDRLCEKIRMDFGPSIGLPTVQTATPVEPSVEDLQPLSPTIINLKNLLAKGQRSKTADAATPKPRGSSNFATKSKCHRVVLDAPGRIDDIRLVEETVPDLKQDEVRIAVHAFSLNFGDLLCVSGMYPTMPSYPFTPGFEASGEVVAVGDAVTAVGVGDPVIALMGKQLGGQGSVVTCTEAQLLRKPISVSFEEASAFPVVTSTMVGAFRRADLQSGERILIQSGAGGSGLIAVQMAKHRGAEIFATVGSDWKIEYLKTLGVHHVINYRQTNFEDEIKRLTAGRGVDVVINTLPGDALQKGIRSLSAGGRYVELAMTALRSAKSIDLSVMSNNQSYHSLDFRRLLIDNPTVAMSYMSDGLALLEKRIVSPTIEKVFEIDQIVDAYRHLASRESVGKIVVRVPGR